MDARFQQFDLTGRRAVVTGGGTGLGYHMARGLARSGASVLICARREAVLVAAAAALRTEMGDIQIHTHTVDLADNDSVVALADHAIATMGGVDIFVGNAGMDCLEHVDTIRNESVLAMCQVNVAANIALFRAFLPGMRAAKFGRVIFSSSGTTVCASPQEGMSVYTAVKGALNAFSRTAATEVGRDGITVNSLILGIFRTDMVDEIVETYERAEAGSGQAFIDSFSSMTALGRFGRLDEVEGLVQFVASNAANYLTGTNLVFDGGLTVMLRPNPVG